MASMLKERLKSFIRNPYGKKNHFHFVSDYRALVRKLIREHDIDEAMSLAVGGSWFRIGQKQAMLLRSLGLKSGMSVFDLGCGSGRTAYALSQELDIPNYLGIDIVEELLRYAASKSPDHYKFKLNHALAIPADNDLFDYAYGFSIFTHLLQTEIMLYTQEVWRILKPGGFFLFSFLEMEKHWDIFEASVIANKVHGRPKPHLNMFLDRNQISILAEKTKFKVNKFVEPKDGVGQSCVVLEKVK